MPANDYHFVTRWRIFGTATEIFDVLSRPEDYPRWWPSVYLAASELETGNGDGVGRQIALLTKGWLPYTLSWELQVTASRPPRVFEFDTGGDFVGGGRWELEPSGAWVDVTLDWGVRAEKPLVSFLSPVLRPLFGANHRWAMRRGEESLVLELARRRAATPGDRERVPPPPRATTSSPLPALAAAAAVLLLAGAILRAASRRRGALRR
ncbi:MAG: SRPBCC family protein [Thermoanaerobaculia bacterium]